MTAASSVGWAYRPALDGLRTVAVALVVLFHCGVPWVANGYIGVDVFFVLSGYLVGQVLLDEHRRTGAVRLGRFYARRVRRLLPAAIVLVLGVCAVSLVVRTGYTREQTVPGATAALTYVANWHFLADATDYFAADPSTSPFLHFWSLAIEEQFYVVFPLLLLAALALGRRAGRRWLPAAAIAVVAFVSAMLQVGVAPTDPQAAYYATHLRVYQLLFGVLLAMAARAIQEGRLARVGQGAHARATGAIAVAALGVLLVLAGGIVDVAVSTRGIAAAIVSVLLVAAVEAAPASAIARVLSFAPMVGIGKLSYGVYLWHWPLVVLSRDLVQPSPLVLAALVAVGSLALASLSYHAIERPVRTLGALDRWPVWVAVGGATASVAVGLFVVGPILRVDATPAVLSRPAPLVVGGADEATAAALAAEVGSSLDLDVDPPAFDVGACSITDLDACTLHRADGAHVLLLGDSNAQYMVPVLGDLAAQHGFTLSAAIAHGCPWQQGLLWETPNEGLVRSCAQRRNEWYSALIPALDPDVIVIVHINRDGEPPWVAPLRAQNPTDERPVAEVVAEATRNSLGLLTAGGASVVLLEPLEYPTFDTRDCLAGAVTVGACAWLVSESPLPTTALYREVAAELASVSTISLTSIVCPLQPVCVPLLDGELVLRDRNHVAAAWWQRHATAVWSAVVVAAPEVAE